MTTAASRVGRTLRWHLLLTAEGVRSSGELAGLAAVAPALARAPRGDGHAVLVIPGWLAADASTLALRTYLRRLGYDVHGWGQGVNRGPSVAVVNKLREQLTQLAQTSGGPVSLIGWSLGGLYAYELARRRPGDVRQVITLGTPAPSTGRVVKRASRLADRAGGGGLPIGPVPRPWREAGSVRVPVTAVHSRTDSISPWRGCLVPTAPRRQNVEVRGSHLGLGHNPAVVYLVADRLAQSGQGWRPFRAPRWLGPAYPQRATRPRTS